MSNWQEYIPTVPITQEQVDAKLECSICLEEFKFSESVRRLECAHVYHEACIAPWLNQHNKCPTCRRLTVDGVEETEVENHYTSFSDDEIEMLSDEITDNDTGSGFSIEIHSPSYIDSDYQNSENLSEISENSSILLSLSDNEMENGDIESWLTDAESSSGEESHSAESSSGEESPGESQSDGCPFDMVIQMEAEEENMESDNVIEAASMSDDDVYETASVVLSDSE